jgi:hypothetical protein
MTVREAAFQVESWNAHNRVGQAVRVLLDDGSFRRTETSSDAWVVAPASPVVVVDGISGGFSLLRVAPDWA